MANLQVVLPKLAYIGGKFHENVAIIVNLSSGKIDDIVYNANTKISAFSNMEIKSFPNRAFIPGLINCHSHAFQRGLRGFGETYPQNTGKDDDWWSWREKMYDLVCKCTKEEIYNLTYQCFYEMRRSGITAVGEFHYIHHSSANANDYAMDDMILAAANNAGVRLVLLQTYYHSSDCGNKTILDKQRKFYTETVSDYLKQIEYLQAKTQRNALQSVGIVAHSIRAAHISDIKQLHEFAVKNQMVMHMHMEEVMGEVDSCRAHYNDAMPARLLLDTLDNSKLSNFTTVHNTLTSNQDLHDLVKCGVNICVCPLTEGNLGDGIFNLEHTDREQTREIVASMCVGSDCNARIDFFEELRVLEYLQRLKYRKRGVYAKKANDENITNVLFKIATIQGAKALNLQCGEIRKGAYADLVGIDLSATSLHGWTRDTLLTSMIFGACGYEVVTDSCIHGQWMHYKPAVSKL